MKYYIVHIFYLRYFNKIVDDEYYYYRGLVKANNISEALLIELERLSYPDEDNEEHIEYVRSNVIKSSRQIIE